MQKLRYFRALAVSCLTVIITSYAFTQAPATPGANPPWYPSLMAFEHYDSARTHVFEQAQFSGSFSGANEVDVRVATDNSGGIEIFPTGYNMVYMSPDEIFLYGGGYGNITNATGAFVSKVDRKTLKQVWKTQVINTDEANEWDYPGVVSLLDDGYLYLIYGYRLAKIDPKDGTVKATLVLPTGDGLPENTSFNGFDALPDGTLIAKALYREAGCPVQGPPALIPGNCPDVYDVPPPVLVSIDPKTMTVLDTLQLEKPVVGRPTTARFRGKDYVYLTDTTTAFRCLIKKGHITLDSSWNPGNIYKGGQTNGSAVVMMNDWFVVQTNSGPATEALSVVVINQADASKQFFAQPFKDFPVPPSYPKSWAPMSVSVDPSQNLIYAIDSSPGVIGALKLTDTGLQTVWTKQQRTTEFLALIGPAGRRVVVGTEIPPGQAPVTNTTDFVVWRDAQDGRELARTKQLPKMTSGTMIQPYYFGKMFYNAMEGPLFQVTVRPRLLTGQ